jgi:hypothetical protein
MENVMITLNASNCSAKAISHKNNVLVHIFKPDGTVPISAVMNKKYFNQISSKGDVQGRLRDTDDGLIIFEGFSFN